MAGKRNAAAELVVQATEDHVGIAACAFGERGKAHAIEARVMTIFEDVIVFDADRPIGSEADFQDGTDGGAPTGVISRVPICDSRAAR